MSSMDLRPVEKAKISCAKKLFNEINPNDVVYELVDTYENLLKILDSDSIKTCNKVPAQEE